MKKNSNVLILVTLALFVALGVVISPILRFEGFAPTTHFVNVVSSVFLGPWYSLLNGTLTAIIRMTVMGIPSLAFTGQVFGAVLSGVLYRKTNGKILWAVIGEVVGTGIIGSIVSYPVMRLLMGKTGLTIFFYTPSFLIATLIGGSIAFIFLKTLQRNGTLYKIQKKLGVNIYERSKRNFSN